MHVSRTHEIAYIHTHTHAVHCLLIHIIYRKYTICPEILTFGQKLAIAIAIFLLPAVLGLFTLNFISVITQQLLNGIGPHFGSK